MSQGNTQILLCLLMAINFCKRIIHILYILLLYMKICSYLNDIRFLLLILKVLSYQNLLLFGFFLFILVIFCMTVGFYVGLMLRIYEAEIYFTRDDPANLSNHGIKAA